MMRKIGGGSVPVKLQETKRCLANGAKKQTRQYTGNCSRRGCKIHGSYIGVVDGHDGTGFSFSPHSQAHIRRDSDVSRKRDERR